MRTVLASVVVAGLGLVASGAVSSALARRRADHDPHVQWALGLLALLPAWLVAFLALLGAAPVRRPEVTVVIAWTSSTALALIGAIMTEARVRREAEAGRVRPPAWQWRAGVLAFVPALLVALLGLLGR